MFGFVTRKARRIVAIAKSADEAVEIIAVAAQQLDRTTAWLQQIVRDMDAAEKGAFASQIAAVERNGIIRGVQAAREASRTGEKQVINVTGGATVTVTPNVVWIEKGSN